MIVTVVCFSRYVVEWLPLMETITAEVTSKDLFFTTSFMRILEPGIEKFWSADNKRAPFYEQTCYWSKEIASPELNFQLMSLLFFSTENREQLSSARTVTIYRRSVKCIANNLFEISSMLY